nr:hypothetical protein [Luteimonas huabeiensis]
MKVRTLSLPPATKSPAFTTWPKVRPAPSVSVSTTSDCVGEFSTVTLSV